MNINKSVIGVDIGTHSIKIVSLAGRLLKFPTVTSFSEVEVPEKAISPRGISEPDKFVISLNKAIASLSPKKMKCHFACSSLPESTVLTKVVTLPKMTKKESKSALDSELVNILPKPPGEMEIDFQMLGSTLDQVDFLVVAADKKLVADYVKLFSSVGLELIRLDTMPAALGRAVIGSRKDPIILIDIGAHSSSISIYDWGQIRITATVPVGGDIWREVVSEQEKKDAQSNKSAAEFGPNLTPIIEEVENTARYYQTRSLTPRVINQIYLAGGGSRLSGIEEYFQEKLSIPTSIAKSCVQLLNNMDIRFINACGCAIDPPL